MSGSGASSRPKPSATAQARQHPAVFGSYTVRSERPKVQIVCGRTKFDRVCHELPDSTPPRLATRWSGPPVRSSLVAARPPGDASVHRGARVRCGAGRSAKILDDFGFAESFVDPRAHKSPLSQNFPRKVSLARNTCGRREGRRVRDRRDSKGTAGAEDPGDQSGSGPLSRAIGGRIECLAYPVEPLTRRRGAATGKAGPYPVRRSLRRARRRSLGSCWGRPGCRGPSSW
jgi:hypothetical protein